MIGLALIIVCILIPVAHKIFHFETIASKKEMIKTIIKDCFMLGLVFIAFAKDKIEDELTMLLRLKSLASGVFFSFAYMFASDFLNIILGEPIEPFSAYHIIFNTLAWQITFYYLAKSSR
jgi:hypothetical protein